ncbi:MAG: hypothetical protein NVS2B7_05970 [Herpetosiphon sp.]
MPQPVVDKAKLAVFKGGQHTAAAIMATDDHMGDLQDFDRILQDREAVQVSVGHHVRNIAMDKEVARQHIDDLVGRDPTVGATDPQVVGRLLLF